MTNNIIKTVLAFCIVSASYLAQAADITVTRADATHDDCNGFAGGLTLAECTNSFVATGGGFPPLIPPTTGTAGDITTPGSCTLREAILSAQGERAASADECTGPGAKDYCPFNADGTLIAGECAAGDSDAHDTIVIDVRTASTSDPINLDAQLPDIDEPLTIVGLGPDQTEVVAADGQRMVNVSADLAQGETIALANFTASGSTTVANTGGLTMDAGLTSPNKRLVLSNMRFEDNQHENVPGGAILVRGAVDLVADSFSTFRNNAACAGGAIAALQNDFSSPSISFNSALFFSNSTSGTPCDGGVTLGGSVTVNEHGGALLVDARGAEVAKIGSARIEGNTSRFEGNNTGRNGGALAFINVTNADENSPAIEISNTVLGAGSDTTQLNKAANGGALYIQGHENTDTNVEISRSSFAYNNATADGGAIYYESSPGAEVNLDLTNVSIGYNTATGDGAGLYVKDNDVTTAGLLNVIKVTFDTNVAMANGGAIYCQGTKGGEVVGNPPQVLGGSQLTNVTISGNEALNGGGLYVSNRCHLSINNTTITDNLAESLPTGMPEERGLGVNGGGGIFVWKDAANARVDLRNSILADNGSYDSGMAPDVDSNQNLSGPDCSAADDDVLRSGGNNIVGTIAGCGDDNDLPFANTPSGAGCVIVANGDRVGDASGDDICDIVDPELRLLQDNGGPDIVGGHNFTHMPDTGSPAINNGDSDCLDAFGNSITEDQRQAPRQTPEAGNCDIGAVETNVEPQGDIAVSNNSNSNASVTRQLINGVASQPLEMLRFTITAPDDAGKTVTALRLRGGTPQTGIPGNYSSVRDILITLDTGSAEVELYNQPRPAQFVSGQNVTINLGSNQVAIPAGASRTFVVYYIFGPSEQLASVAEPHAEHLMIAGSGLALMLPLLGLVGVRNRRLAVVAVLVAVGITACGGGDSDDDDTVVAPPPPDPTSTDRTFRLQLTGVTTTEDGFVSAGATGPTAIITPQP